MEWIRQQCVPADEQCAEPLQGCSTIRHARERVTRRPQPCFTAVLGTSLSPGTTGFNTDAFPLSAFTAPVTGKSERAAQLASSVSVLGSTLSPQEEFMPAAIA